MLAIIGVRQRCIVRLDRAFTKPHSPAHSPLLPQLRGSVRGNVRGAHMSKKAAKDHAGVIAPPPLIFVVFMVLGWPLEFWRPTTVLTGPLWSRIGIGLIVLAVLIIFIAGFQFWRARTSPEPWRPTTAIVETGLFRYSRNPMYLAGALFHIGVALLLGSLWVAVSLLPALVVLHYGVIRREEIYLTRKFGDAYRSYLARVPRWL
jgi:protein-S-isoprenylcysteine O-methyltransferase Ste14